MKKKKLLILIPIALFLASVILNVETTAYNKGVTVFGLILSLLCALVPAGYLFIKKGERGAAKASLIYNGALIGFSVLGILKCTEIIKAEAILPVIIIPLSPFAGLSRLVNGRNIPLYILIISICLVYAAVSAGLMLRKKKDGFMENRNSENAFVNTFKT